MIRMASHYSFSQRNKQSFTRIVISIARNANLLHYLCLPNEDDQHYENHRTNFDTRDIQSAVALAIRMTLIFYFAIPRERPRTKFTVYYIKLSQQNFRLYFSETRAMDDAAAFDQQLKVKVFEREELFRLRSNPLKYHFVDWV